MKKPHVTKTTHLLPFDELSPAQFERLSLWLVASEGYLRPEHLGEGGSEEGRDVIAYWKTNDSEQLWYFQCKRYKTISAGSLIKEVEKYNSLVGADPTKNPFGIVFVTNAVLSATARERVRKACSQQGYACEFWARTELDMLVNKHSDIVAHFFNVPPLPTLPDNTISIARLPTSGSDLFGRDAELQLLDQAWENPKTHIITFVAWGGAGKTALVNHWLKQRMARDGYRGAERVYGWSFYSQGTSEQAASADLFIDQALRWFGDTDPTAGLPWDKGERLAHFIRQTRTLIVLDGLEPLQHPPGPQEGQLKDAAVQTLLIELAAQQPGLCVITTRERLSDLVEFENGTVIQQKLDQLSPGAGAQLLRTKGVEGDDDELEQATTEYQGHALALTLLGSYLSDVCAGNIRQRNEIESLEEDVRHGRHAEKVMRAYEKWLGEGVELAVLRLLGLFDRPAESASMSALRAAPAIPGLTESLQNLKAREWQQALAKLRRIELLGLATASEPETLDAHPLVREHFKQQLKRSRPDAWRKANDRLYEHLKSTAKEFPNTMKEMSILYAAVVHGCAAGKHQRVFEDVLVPRIRRENEHFSLENLGAYSADLAALQSFLPVIGPHSGIDLTKDTQAFLWNEVGYNLRALGRLQEARQPMQEALETYESLSEWRKSAIVASNLSQVSLLLGNVSGAIAYGQQSVGLADLSSDGKWRRSSRATFADALHQAGNLSDSLIIFREAEMITTGEGTTQPLNSMSGFRYYVLLLDQGAYEEVRRRATQTVGWAKQNGLLIAIALDNLALGLTCLLLPRLDGDEKSNLAQAASYLHVAVDGLRESGRFDYLPQGLLARAALHRINRKFERAERDLAEVLRIATRGGMDLHLADHHLESARLQLGHGNRDKAREHWVTAKEMIERMGYHRRDGEVKLIGTEIE